MEISASRAPRPPPSPHQDIERIRQMLIRKGVYPATKFIRGIRKKELENPRREGGVQAALNPEPLLSKAEELEIARRGRLQKFGLEFRDFCRALNAEDRSAREPPPIVAKPWEDVELVKLEELTSENADYREDELKAEHVTEVIDILEQKRHELKWLLGDGIEVEGGSKNLSGNCDEKIAFLVSRLSATYISVKGRKFTMLMKQSGIRFTEDRLLKLLDELSARGQWKPAIYAVKWVYRLKSRCACKSRTVYTKLLAILRKAKQPGEALRIFYTMLGDSQLYPDIASYHVIAVTLGQAGHLRELLNVIGCMRQEPSRKIEHPPYTHREEVIEPDLIVYNAILNACIPTRLWKGVAWVFQNLRKSHISPDGATYGFAMEVMLSSGKYSLVENFFVKMQTAGLALTAHTYRVLVRALRAEGKVDKAVSAVRDMEGRGITGTAGVYFEVACCLCTHGRWRDAISEIENLKKVPHHPDPAVAFTGMIGAAADAGRMDDATAIFEEMKYHCKRGVGMVNAMLRAYGSRAMFSEARDLFESVPVPALYTYTAMLGACRASLEWDYFELVYRQMTAAGFRLHKLRHGFLLLEASRAGGKWQLLEHAFDRILQAGGVPPLDFFLELICGAVSRRCFERAVTLVGSLSYAPYDVDRDYLTDLLRRQLHSLGGVANLRDLEQALLSSVTHHESCTEPTFTHFLSAVRSVCSAPSPEAATPSAHLSSVAASTSHGDIDVSHDDVGGIDDDDAVFDVSSYNEMDFGRDAQFFSCLRCPGEVHDPLD